MQSANPFDTGESDAVMDNLSAAAAGSQGIAPLGKDAKRVWIQLEDSDEIPPTGQFFGVNGRSYVLRAGEPAAVPEEVIAVLEDAITAVPVLDQFNNVTGFRDRLRFPFRYVNQPRAVAA